LALETPRHPFPESQILPKITQQAPEMTQGPQPLRDLGCHL
jgi:hypothetical protein